MFVYNYMAGTVDWLHGGEAEQEYDPHDHRKVPRPTTYMETMIHVLKGAIGTGMLAMPYAISRLGIVVGPLSIVVIAAFATYCIQILVRAQYMVCKKWKRGYMTFENSVQLAVESGPPSIRWTAKILSKSVDTFLFIWQMGVCAIFCVFVAENVKQLCEIWGGSVNSVRMVILYTYPIQMLMCTVKDIKRLTPFSTVANICVVIGLFLMFFYLIEDDIEFDESQLVVQSLQDVPVFIGIVLYALQAPGIMLAVEYNMEGPKRFRGIFGLFSIAMVIVTVIFIALGLFGFLKYGHSCLGSITLNLPSKEKKAQAAKLAVALSVYMTYPLQNFVPWQIVWQRLSKKCKKNARLVDYIWRFVVTTFPFLLAVAAPTLGAFMGLCGALCITVIAIIIPAIMDVCVFYPDQLGPCQYKIFTNIIIVIIGFVCCVSGVYTSLLEMAAA